MKSRAKLMLFALLLVSSTALAADGKRMAANNCLLQRDWFAGDDDYDRGGARIGAHVGGFFGFVCPLVRSNTTNTNGLTSLILNLHKYGAGQLLCYAESVDVSGNLLLSVSKSTTVTGLQPMTWANTLNTSSAKGTYSIRCNANGGVPFGDELFSIDYTEP